MAKMWRTRKNGSISYKWGTLAKVAQNGKNVAHS